MHVDKFLFIIHFQMQVILAKTAICPRISDKDRAVFGGTQ